MKTIVSKLNRFVAKSPPSNDNQPFDSANKLVRPTTVGEFNRDLHQIIAAHGLSNSAVNDLLGLLRDHTSTLDLPLSAVDKIPFSEKVISSNIIKSFVPIDPNDFSSDACRHECMVFRGVQKDPKDKFRTATKDCSVLLNCMHCDSPRYSRCSHKDCRKAKVEYKNCSPFDGKGHSDAYRVSMKRVYYRSIIGKLIQLYCLSQVEGYEDILSYDDFRIKVDGKIIDILDGTEFIRHKRKMDENYTKVKAKFSKANSGQFLHQCSILLTLSYDGVVNFKRKLDSMWPLLTSVVNCNPSHRAKMGTGMFLTMLHNAGVGSGIEKHMMEEMLVQELKKLERGLIFTIPSVNGVETKHVYLQARLLYTHLDTKALEKMGLLKLCNSLYGCTLCNLQTGSYRHTLHKCVYKNTRLPLHENHILRSAGQRTFLGESAWLIKEKVAGLSAAEKELYYFMGDKLYSRVIKAECEAAVQIINSLDCRSATKLPANWDIETATRFSNKKPAVTEQVWHHTDPRFAPVNFINRVKYAFADHRKPVQYASYSNEDYFTNGLIARQKREADEEQYRPFDANGVKKKKYKTKRPKKAKDCSYNGCHDISPIVEHCESFGFPNFSFDPMHWLLNASNYFLKAYKGERGLSAGSRILEVSQNTHTVLKFKKLHPRWTIKNSDQERADAVINGLLLPPQYKNDFSMKNPFRLRGYLKAREHMIFLMVFASFALSFTTIGVEYIVFAAMFAADLCMLFNPCLVIADLKRIIIPCVYETRAVQEGLFPESEQVFIFHEVVDIVNHIKLFGHLRGLMCFASERANGLISQSLSKGGVNYMHTLYNRYMIRENGFLGCFLDRPVTDYDNRGIYSDYSLKLYGEMTSVRLDDIRCNRLFKTVFVFLQTQVLDNLFHRSQFFRLYSAYEHMRENKGSLTSGFYTWFVKFLELYDSSSQHTEGSLSRFCVHFNFLTDCSPSEVVNASVGHVFESDLLFLRKRILLASKPVEAYEQIVVKGVRIDGRGVEYGRAGEHNDLPTQWSVKRFYKSWFRCKHHNIVICYNNNNQQTRVETSRSVTHEIRFGQLDFAFRLNFPEDEFLHGLAIGHCVQRKPVYSEKRWQHFVKPAVGIVKADSFVCLNYIDSTAIAVCALNKDSKVMFTSHDTTSFTPTATQQNEHCYAKGVEEQKLAQLFLIPIHPERLNIEYGDVFTDKDGTRVWENSLRLREEPGKNCQGYV